MALWAPFRVKSGTKWDKLVLTLLGLACALSFTATMACIPGRNGMSLTAERLKGDAAVHAGLTMFILHWISFSFCFVLWVGIFVLSVPGMILGNVKSTAAEKLSGGKDQSLKGVAGGIALGSLKSGAGRFSERWSGRGHFSPKKKPHPVEPVFVV